MSQVGETLSAESKPVELPLGTGESQGIEGIARGKPSAKNPLGRVAFDSKALEDFQRKPLESQRESLRKQWLSIAHMVLAQAGSLCMSLPKKDYGRLVQLLTSAGISYDKVFPKVDTVQGNNLVLNLFNGLPKDKLVRVIGEVPVPSSDTLEYIPLPTPTEGQLPK